MDCLCSSYFGISKKSCIKKWYLLVALLHSCILFGQEVNADTFNLLRNSYDKKKIQVLERIRGKDKKSICSFIMDGENNLFLVKQTTYNQPSGALLAVRDMLGADIAQRSDISANHVRLIPSNTPFPGKVRNDIAATVHLLVPGLSLSKKSELYIQQPLKSYIPKKLWGISLSVIRSMAVHPDLAQITALDTFIGNAARRNSSCFYDEETDRFYAIDLESGFKNPLADLACTFFKKLIADKKLILTGQEIEGLKIYRDTLAKLISQNPAKEQHNKLDYFIKIADIDTKKSDVRILVALYKSTIQDNYKKSQELVNLVSRLINKHAGKTVIMRSKKTYACLWHETDTRYHDISTQSKLGALAAKIAAYKVAYGE